MTLLILIIGAIAGAAVVWWWSLRSMHGANELAVAVVLATCAAAFNLVVPIPNVEATTMMVVCSSLVLGVRVASIVGALAVLATGITGGLGYWTAWQVLGYAVVAVLSVVLLFAWNRRHDVSTLHPLVLAGVTVIVTGAYDIIVTVPGVQIALTSGASFSSAMQGALLIGAPFTLVHIGATTAMTAVAGPPLIRALTRARRRLSSSPIRQKSIVT